MTNKQLVALMAAIIWGTDNREERLTAPEAANAAVMLFEAIQAVKPSHRLMDVGW